VAERIDGPVPRQAFSRWGLARVVRHRGAVLRLGATARHVLLTVAAHTHESDGAVCVSVSELREETGISKSAMHRVLRELAADRVLVLERGCVAGWGVDHELYQAAQAYARGARQAQSTKAPRAEFPRRDAVAAPLSADEQEAFEVVRVELMRAKAERAGGVAVVEVCAPELARRLAVHVSAQAAALGMERREYASALARSYLSEQRDAVTRARHPLAMLAQEIQLSTCAAKIARRASTARAPRPEIPQAQEAPISQVETRALVAQLQSRLRSAT